MSKSLGDGETDSPGQSSLTHFVANTASSLKKVTPVVSSQFSLYFTLQAITISASVRIPIQPRDRARATLSSRFSDVLIICVASFHSEFDAVAHLEIESGVYHPDQR